jgi:hypothetical protein
LQNNRVPSEDEISEIMQEGIKIYQTHFKDGNVEHLNFEQPLNSSVYQKYLKYILLGSSQRRFKEIRRYKDVKKNNMYWYY